MTISNISCRCGPDRGDPASPPQASGTELALRLPQQQQTAIGGLVAALEIHCEFLAADCWQVEGKRRIVVHRGCGAGLIAQGSSIGHRFAM